MSDHKVSTHKQNKRFNKKEQRQIRCRLEMRRIYCEFEKNLGKNEFEMQIQKCKHNKRLINLKKSSDKITKTQKFYVKIEEQMDFSERNSSVVTFKKRYIMQ